MWRTNWWCNPYKTGQTASNLTQAECFEVGADAILKSLLEGEDTIYVGRHERVKTPGMSVSGTWVFIPEEE